MARIRTIKPEFFTSDDICALSPLARLLYVGLWCEADREGRMVWLPRVFKRRYLPDDACDLDAVTGELLERGLVRLYDEGLAVIPTFHRHQHVNPREAMSKLPPPPGDASPRDRLASERDRLASERERDAQGGREGEGSEREREGERERESEREGAPEALPGAAGAHALPENWKPDEDDLAWAQAQRPDLTPVLLQAETDRFRNHALANGRTAHRWGPNWRNWIQRAHRPSESSRTDAAGTMGGAMGGPMSGPMSGTTGGTVDRDSDGQWRARLRGYRPGRFWLEGDWGPRPESGQSRVPAGLLGEWLLEQTDKERRP